jgi:hypothetical protein
MPYAFLFPIKKIYLKHAICLPHAFLHHSLSYLFPYFIFLIKLTKVNCRPHGSQEGEPPTTTEEPISLFFNWEKFQKIREIQV